MRKECAISTGKLLKTIYSSCNKAVIYLLAGKYAVDIDCKNRYINITAYFPANK